MRAPRRSYSSALGYSTWNDWPISSSRDAPNMSHSCWLQSTIERLRDRHRPTGARSKARR